MQGLSTDALFLFIVGNIFDTHTHMYIYTGRERPRFTN